VFAAMAGVLTGATGMVGRAEAGGDDAAQLA
jgi:hypothetical protein